MIGTGIPALDRGVPPARPAGARGTAAQSGDGFGDAVKSAARQPERHSSSRSGTAADSAGAPTQAAGDSSGGMATTSQKGTPADAGAAKEHQPAAAGSEEAPSAKDASADGGEDEEKKKKDAAGSAAGMALSLVLPGTPVAPAKAEDAADTAAASKQTDSKAKAVTPPAAAGNGAVVKEALSVKPAVVGEATAAATMEKQHEPARQASSADGEKAAAARPGGADGKTALAGDARIDPDSLRHAGGQDAAGSALSGLRARLSQAHTAADGAPHRQAADVRSAAQAHERQGLSARAAQAGPTKEAERPSRSDHAGAKAETVSASIIPATAAPAPQGGNAAALADAIAARPDWTQALAKSADVASGAARPAHVSALRLQLNPADLGVVTATLRVTGNQLVISLQVHTAEAYRQLSTGNEAILDKLKGHGYAVENITVQHVAVAGSAASQQAQQQPGFTSQQGGHHAAAGGGHQSSGHGQGQGSGGRSGFFDQAQRRPDEPVGVGGVRRRSSGGLYV